jgi:subtilisin family serine protease
VLALLVLVLVAIGAGAQPNARESGRHLFSVPKTGPSAAALAKTDARQVARYGAFTLVEASGADADRLRRAGADLRDDMREVRLGSAEVDPARERAPLAGSRAGRGGRALAVVQFAGPIKEAWLRRLEGTGVRVVTYMAENAYLVSGSGGELAAVRSLVDSDPAFRALVAYSAADKLGAGIRSEGRQRLAVQTLSGADGSRARGRVADLGRRLRQPSAVGPFRTQFVELDAAEAAALAGRPGVVSIQPAPVPRLRDERADQIVAGALTGADPLLPSGPGYLAFHDGLGLGTAAPFPFVVDVTDEGIDRGSTDTDLADLHQDGSSVGASRLAYVTDYTADPDARDCGGHGTINTSIIGGFNNGTGATVEDAQGFNYGLGVAPRVQLGGSKVFRCTTGAFQLAGTFTGLAGSAYANGARISNNSWGTDVAGAYDADSQEFDAIVRDTQPGTPGNQELVEVVAAGNAGPGTGTIGSPATAKNVIAVGASESVRASGTDGCGATNTRADDAHDVAPFSSRGPTEDARFKPDILAPGTHITGSHSQADGYNGSGVCDPSFPSGSTLYSLSTGTSHSTPVVAGMAALFREWYRQRKGGGTDAPSPALTRAALANASTDLVGGAGAGGSVPNSNQGWGLGNLTRLLDTGTRFLDQETRFDATGDSFSQGFAVTNPARPVRVTLAWTDPPGPTSGNSFVNNLDLSVTSASGTFKGNVFSGGVSITGGTADPRNNLESVYLPAGTSGDVTVTVTAANIAGNGVPGVGDGTDQDFALVVSDAGPAAPAQPGGLAATPGAGQVALDWSAVPSATGYELFRRDGSGSYPDSPTATTSASEFVDVGLVAGQRYCYVVRAVSDATPGPLSNEACATVPAGSGPGGGGPAPGGGQGAPLAIDLSSLRSTRVGPRRFFRLRFGATPGRAGSLRLRTVRAFATGKRRRLVVARKPFSVPATGRVTARVRLTRAGFRVLTRVRRLRVTARVTIGSTTASKRLTLRAPRPWSRL